MRLGDSLSDDTILAERAKALIPLLDAEAEFADNEGMLSPAAVAAARRLRQRQSPMLRVVCRDICVPSAFHRRQERIRRQQCETCGFS